MKAELSHILMKHIHSTYSTQSAWSDNTTKGCKVPVAKGSRLIIVHACAKEGFIPNALLIFKSGSMSADYHGSMNFHNYQN